jgi:hypothetical protein
MDPAVRHSRFVGGGENAKNGTMLAPTPLATIGLFRVCSLPNLANVDETGA